MKLTMNPRVRADAVRVDDELTMLKGEVFDFPKKEADELLTRPWKRTRMPLFVKTDAKVTPRPEPEEEIELLPEIEGA